MIFYRVLLVIGWVFLSTISAFSQTSAIVKSGEHANFTRIVINGQNLGGWKTITSPNNFVISFVSFSKGFDISDVFRRIGRDRIKNILSDRSKISLILACNCNVVVTAEGTNLIIVDVLPKSPQSENLGKYNKAQATLQFPSTLMRRASYPEYIIGDASVPPLPIHPSVDVLAKKNIESMRRAQIETSEISPSSNMNTDQAHLIESLRNQLSNSFGAASTRSILRPDMTSTSTQLLTNSLSISNQSFLSKNPNILENFSIQSSLERPTMGVDEFSKGSQIDDCDANRNLQISEWSDGRSFEQQLGQAKAELYDTLGEIDIDAAIKLARLYLFFGFGSEAKQVLSILPTSINNQLELEMVANALDQNTVAKLNPKFSDLECSGPLMFWTALSRGGIERKFRNRKSEILLELSVLPIHLRRVFAPTISSRFMEIGSPNFAAAALQTLKRTQYNLDSGAELEQSALLIADNKPNEALEKLANIRSNDLAAAKALVEKIALKLSLDAEIDKVTFDLIEGYHTEFEDTELGSELEKIAILTLSRSGEFSLAYKRAGEVNPKNRANILEAIDTDLVKRADDSSFIELAFSRNVTELSRQNPKLAQEFSQRFFDLGFYMEAEENFSLLSEEQTSVPISLLRAKISIALDKLTTAEAFLMDIDTTDANLLRAKVQDMRGKHFEAAQLYEQAGRSEEHAHNAWLSKDWPDQFANTTGIVNQLVQLSNSEVVTPSDQIGMLGQIDELLAESNRSRSVISNILNEPKLPLLGN